MIERTITGELEPHEDRALQKIGRKKQAKSPPLLMELPDLNTALVEAYRDLDRTTRGPNKWRDATKRHKSKHNVPSSYAMSPSKERQPLGLPPSSNAPHSPTPHPSATTQTEPPTRNYEEELEAQIAITV